MLTLTISEEQLNAAITQALEKVLAPDNYNNPLKSLVEKAIGTTYAKGALTEQLQEKISDKIKRFMETPHFDIMLGQAVAKAIADREVSKSK